MRPTARDKQSKVGPSDLGNPCPRCLARSMLSPERGVETIGSFSLFPWIGTAGHFYLQHTVFQEPNVYLHEQKLFIGTIPDYGDIKGTADLIEIDEAVWDWKFVGLKKIKQYRLSGSPKGYRYQRQLYGLGCENAGRPVKTVGNVYIPRDSGNANDIWIDEEEYDREVGERALARADDVYHEALVKGWDALPSDPDCYVCNYRGWGN